MESFWTWLKDDMTSPATLLVLGFFAVLIVSALIAKLRKRRPGSRFFLWEVVSAVANWFK